MRRSLAMILVAVLLATGCSVTLGYGTENSKKTVRIGWFASDGVHTIDADGTCSGYDYDYLQAISQYTDWEYEFVSGTWSECYDWLKNGDIDLMGIVNKTPEREASFDYSYTSAGTEMCCLFVSRDSRKYSYQDFKAFDGMSIGIEEGTYQSQVLKEYAEENNFTYTTKTYPTLAHGQEALNRKEIDALLASNTDVISGYKAIAQFNPIPFYYAVTKGNAPLLKELNYAMNELFTNYPKFSSDLYSRYYGDGSSAEAVFSSAELDYIKTAPSVRVLYDPLWYPIEARNVKTDTFEGIVPDLLHLISKKSGIEFTYENSGSGVAALKELVHTNDNLVSSITHDYKWASQNNVNITPPFMDASMMCVKKDPKSASKTVALVRVDYISKMVESLLPELKVTYFESMAQCMEAVRKGVVDCAYLNNYEAEYYMTMARYRNLSFHTTDLFRQKLCIGVSKDADPYLFSIICKSLQSIPEADLQNIIYNNSYHVTAVTLESFAQANPLFVMATSLSFIFIILGGAMLILRNEKKHSRKIAVENERYHQLAEMTDEHIYEYSYEADTLSFNNRTETFLEGKNTIQHYSQYASEYLDAEQNPDNTLYSCFAGKEDLKKEILTSQFDGRKSWYCVTNKIIRDVDNRAIYAIGKIQNVQSSHDEKEHLIDCANRDGMTGLYNAKAFAEQAERELAPGAALFIMDVDHFKEINDRYGHYNGDIALVSIAKTLSDLFEKIGLVSRLGGDEFGVFIPERKTTEEISLLCQAILEGVSAIQVAPVTLSIGVSFVLPGETYAQTYKHSDKLLYEVKQGSRNGFLISN